MLNKFAKPIRAAYIILKTKKEWYGLEPVLGLCQPIRALCGKYYDASQEGSYNKVNHTLPLHFRTMANPVRCYSASACLAAGEL